MKLFVILGLLIVTLSQTKVFADIDFLIGEKTCQEKKQILDLKVNLVVNNRQYNDERDNNVLKKYIRSLEIGSCKKLDCQYCGFTQIIVKENKVYVKQNSKKNKLIEIGTLPENIEPFIDPDNSSDDAREYTSIPLKLSEEFVIKSAKLKKKFSLNTKGDIFDRTLGHGYKYYSLKFIQPSTGKTIDLGF